MSAVSVARIGSDNLFSPFFAGCQHLHQDGACQKPYAKAGRGRAHRDRPWIPYIHNRPLRGGDRHRPQHPLVLGEVKSETIKYRTETKSKGSVIGEVDSFWYLPVRSREVEGQMVGLLPQHQSESAKSIRFNRQLFAPGPIRKLPDPLSQERFRIVNHFHRHRVHHFGPVLLVHGLHSGLSHVVGRYLALKIEPNGLRLARHVDNRVENVFFKPASLHQLDSRDSYALLKNLCGVGGIAPGRHSANVTDVHKRCAPRDQLVLIMDRRDNIYVGVVDSRQVGIVQQKDIIWTDLIFPKAFEDSSYRKSRANHMMSIRLTRGHDLTLGPVERCVVIMLLGGCDSSPGAL